MNFDRNTLSDFFLESVLGKIVSRLFPGILIFLVIDRSLNVWVLTDSNLYLFLLLVFQWMLGFMMEFYNRRTPIIKKLYQLSDTLDIQKQSISLLFSNLVFGVFWSFLISLMIGFYRYVRIDFPYYYDRFQGQYETAPFELEIVAVGLCILLFLIPILMFSDNRK